MSCFEGRVVLSTFKSGIKSLPVKVYLSSLHVGLGSSCPCAPQSDVISGVVTLRGRKPPAFMIRSEKPVSLPPWESGLRMSGDGDQESRLRKAGWPLRYLLQGGGSSVGTKSQVRRENSAPLARGFVHPQPLVGMTPLAPPSQRAEHTDNKFCPLTSSSWCSARDEKNQLRDMVSPTGAVGGGSHGVSHIHKRPRHSGRGNGLYYIFQLFSEDTQN